MILTQFFKQKLEEMNFYIDKNHNLYLAFWISLKGKLTINELIIRNEYAQILYSFNYLKNNIIIKI